MDTFGNEKRWSNQFIPEVKTILENRGYADVVTADDDDDINFATDIIVDQTTRIAVRIRRQNFLIKYANEITIRYSVTSGNKSEWIKIIKDGYGDFMFYGFAVEDFGILKWTMINLNSFRQLFNLSLDDSGDKPAEYRLWSLLESYPKPTKTGEVFLPFDMNDIKRNLAEIYTDDATAIYNSLVTCSDCYIDDLETYINILSGIANRKGLR